MIWFSPCRNVWFGLLCFRPCPGVWPSVIFEGIPPLPSSLRGCGCQTDSRSFQNEFFPNEALIIFLYLVLRSFMSKEPSSSFIFQQVLEGSWGCRWLSSLPALARWARAIPPHQSDPPPKGRRRTVIRRRSEPRHLGALRCAWWVVWPLSWPRCWNPASRREHGYLSSWAPSWPRDPARTPPSRENSHDPARSGFSRGEWSCWCPRGDASMLWSLLSWAGFSRTRHLGKSLLLRSVLPEKQGKKTACGEQVGGAWLRRPQPLAKLTAGTYGTSAPTKCEAVHLRRVPLEGVCIAQSQLLLVKDGPMG